MTNPRTSLPDSDSGRFARATRFAKVCRPRLKVVALPVTLLCRQQFWWALVVAGVAAVIEVIRYLGSPPFMRIRLPTAEEPVNRHE